LKVFDIDGEALMSGRYGIIMSYFAEVRVQRLTKKGSFFRDDPSNTARSHRLDGPKKYGIFHSTIFGGTLPDQLR